MSDYFFIGLFGLVGFVEGVFFFVEYFFRERGMFLRGISVDMFVGFGIELVGVYGIDNRRSWFLIGLVICVVYFLGCEYDY